MRTDQASCESRAAGNDLTHLEIGVLGKNSLFGVVVFL
jgi:hypothetical protein